MNNTLFRDRWGEIRMTWVVIGVLTVVGAVVSGIVFTAVAITNSVDKHRCAQYARMYHRPTEFVRYSFWSHDCLTPDDRGHMIPIDSVSIVVNQ